MGPCAQCFCHLVTVPPEGGGALHILAVLLKGWGGGSQSLTPVHLTPMTHGVPYQCAVLTSLLAACVSLHLEGLWSRTRAGLDDQEGGFVREPGGVGGGRVLVGTSAWPHLCAFCGPCLTPTPGLPVHFNRCASASGPACGSMVLQCPRRRTPFPFVHAVPVTCQSPGYISPHHPPTKPSPSRVSRSPSMSPTSCTVCALRSTT